MERLWGEIVPVPEANVQVLSGGETVLGMRVAYTPGHASHHVCYLHEESGTAFVGDVAACRIPPSDLVDAADAAAGHRHRGLGGIARHRRRLAPERLALTHFGAVEDGRPGLPRERSARRLREEAELATSDGTRTSTRATCSAASASSCGAEGHGEETIAELLQAVPTAYQWPGLDRYWRKRAEREAAA